MSTRRNVFMAKLFGGYKSIFSFHVNHIHINFQVPWVELDMNYGDTFLFIISRANFLVHIDDAHSAVNKRCFLAFGPRKKKSQKRSKSLVAFIHDSFLVLSWFVTISARCVTLLLQWQTSKTLMNVPVTTLPCSLFFPFFHEELQKHFKDIKFLLCSRISRQLLKSCRVLQKEIYFEWHFYGRSYFSCCCIL